MGMSHALEQVANVAFYFGPPGSGKTKELCRLAAEFSWSDRVLILAMNPHEVKRWMDTYKHDASNVQLCAVLDVAKQYAVVLIDDASEFGLTHTDQVIAMAKPGQFIAAAFTRKREAK